MNILRAIPAGIFGTLLMTGALYLLTIITGKNFKVVGILATMVTGHTTPSKGPTKDRADLFIGLLLHYCIGVGFALFYSFLWRSGIGDPGWSSSIVFGLITGCVAAIFWSLFTHWHPDPPAFPRVPYFLLVGLSHVLFSLGVSCVFLIQ